jgi:hypothetical protein
LRQEQQAKAKARAKAKAKAKAKSKSKSKSKSKMRGFFASLRMTVGGPQNHSLEVLRMTVWRSSESQFGGQGRVTG